MSVFVTIFCACQLSCIFICRLFSSRLVCGSCRVSDVVIDFVSTYDACVVYISLRAVIVSFILRNNKTSCIVICLYYMFCLSLYSLLC